MDVSFRILSGANAGRSGLVRLEPGKPVWVGRADEAYGNAVILPEPMVSVHHASIILESGAPFIHDNRSTNGLFQGGQRVEHAPIRPGDRFMFGRGGGPEVEFFFAAAATPQPPAAPSHAPPHPPAAPAHATPEPPTARVVADAPAVPRTVRMLPPAAAAAERAKEVLAAEKLIADEKLPSKGATLLFRARQRGLDKPVLVEVLLHEPGSDTPEERRLLRSARLAAKLHHPNVIALLDLKIGDGYDILVFENLRGLSLADEIERYGRLSPARALALAIPIARGLAHLHGLGIVHRNVRPETVMLTVNEEVKVTHLGLLRPAGADPEPDGAATRPGDLLGSMAHMAPEQMISAGRVDSRADVYGLGALIYHAISGRAPHTDVHRLITGEPPRLETLVPGLPPAVIDVVGRSMDRQPARRYASAGEMLAALERAERTVGPPAEPVAAAPAHVPPTPALGTPQMPAGPSSPGFYAGRLKGMQIVELLQMVELHGEHGTLEIMGDDGEQGTMAFAGGRIVKASCGTLSREEAAYKLLSVRKGFFKMNYGKVDEDPGAPQIGSILFEHMRRTDEGAGATMNTPFLH